MRKNGKKTKSNAFQIPHIIVIIPFLIFLFFITRGINLPYVGYNAWNYNTYSQIAKNYNKFGFSQTGFAPIITVSKIFPSHPVYYLHHPPLISISEALLFRVFGNAFWVGRLTVIIYSFASIVLVCLIASLLRGRIYGFLAVGVASLLPAEVIFGRMIGMEPLVLFFVLFVLYMTLLFQETKKYQYASLAVLGIILGVLSDWPMVYFPLLLFPLLWPKHKKVLMTNIAVAIGAEIVFLLFVAIHMHGFSDLLNAISNRSVGALVHLPYWPLLWIGILGLRFFLYYNPLFVIMSAVVLYYLVKRTFSNKRDLYTTILLICFVFAFLFVALYPEGSFGHAYWIHYFVPFISFASADVLFSMYKRKQFLLLLLIVLISFAFLWRIELWKRKEVATNVWRYGLMKQAATYLKPYETVVTNPDGVIDTDLIMYAFDHTVVQKSPKDALHEKISDHYLFSCIGCMVENTEISVLARQYTYQKITAGEGSLFLFNLKNASSNTPKTKEPSKNKTRANKPLPSKKETLLETIYRQLKDALHAPQI